MGIRAHLIGATLSGLVCLLGVQAYPETSTVTISALASAGIAILLTWVCTKVGDWAGQWEPRSASRLMELVFHLSAGSVRLGSRSSEHTPAGYHVAEHGLLEGMPSCLHGACDNAIHVMLVPSNRARRCLPRPAKVRGKRWYASGYRAAKIAHLQYYGRTRRTALARELGHFSSLGSDDRVLGLFALVRDRFRDSRLLWLPPCQAYARSPLTDVGHGCGESLVVWARDFGVSRITGVTSLASHNAQAEYATGSAFGVAPNLLVDLHVADAVKWCAVNAQTQAASYDKILALDCVYQCVSHSRSYISH